MSLFDFLSAGQSLDDALRSLSLEEIRAARDAPGWVHERPRNYFLPVQAAGESRFAVQHLSEVHFRSGDHIYDCIHQTNRFSLVIGGQAWFITEQEHMRLEPGVFFARLMHEENDFIITSTEPLQLLVIFAPGTRALQVYREISQRPYGIARMLKNVAEIRQLYEHIFEESRIEHQQTPKAVNCLTEFMLRKLRFEQLESTVTYSEAQQTFIACRRYMNAHARELREVRDVAEACHIDPSYLSRIFRRFEGMPPREFLLRLKLGQASELLLSTNMSIQQIAEYLHFSDQFIFSRAFKRVLGMSPKHYRMA